MGRFRLSRMLIGASLATLVSASFAEAQPAAPPKRECFASRDWNGWVTVTVHEIGVVIALSKVAAAHSPCPGG